MLETNIRIVEGGPHLSLAVRRATVQGTDINSELLERTCGKLRHKFRLAAVPLKGQELLVATAHPIPTVRIETEDVALEVVDQGAETGCITLLDDNGPTLIPRLIERALIGELADKTDLWAIDSPRIWYESKPIRETDGIAAYRRYEIGSLSIEGTGVGIAVDIGTAFFTSNNLAYFFDGTVSRDEQRIRHEIFGNLTRRQTGQKGTLLYDIGRSKHKCYFEEAPDGVTCGTTGKIRIKNQTHESLFAYYRRQYPEMSVSEDTPAVRVSFQGIGKPTWAAASCLTVRVMNEELPEGLSNIDKISPRDRRYLIDGFWRRLGPRSLDQVANGFQEGFWRPEAGHRRQFVPVEIEFAQSQVLGSPKETSTAAYKTYYRQRLDFLDNVGCYSVPPAVGRTLYCAYPRTLNSDAARQLAGDMVKKIGQWARRPFDSKLIEYDSVAQAVELVRRSDSSGTVLCVLNEEPAAYHEVAFNLPGWRVKRVTARLLLEQHGRLVRGAWDKSRQKVTRESGSRRWDQFIRMCALDLVQLMDMVPWRAEQLGPYEAQLVIDVGHDRRHFALSLLLSRDPKKFPTFRFVSDVHVKPDWKQETINKVLLADSIVQIVQKVIKQGMDPVSSLLVVRDGQLGGQEPEGIDEAVAKLMANGQLAPHARIDVADFHKDTMKAVRYWEFLGDGKCENPLEGLAIRLNNRMAVFNTTGRTTLHQGTSQPVMLSIGAGSCREILDAAEAMFQGAQLNWSSPATAQRWSPALKRTDEELKARADQEIRNIR